MNIVEQLRRDEEARWKTIDRHMPFTDTTGHLTIGFGRNLSRRGISGAEAEVLLANDVADVDSDVRGEIPWADELDGARRGVLLNMAFNLGIFGLLDFRRMLAALRVRDYERAADEMLDSTWAAQVGDRAQRLSQQMRTGEWM